MNEAPVLAMLVPADFVVALHDPAELDHDQDYFVVVAVAAEEEYEVAKKKLKHLVKHNKLSK